MCWFVFADNISADLRQHCVLDVKPAERFHALHDVSRVDDNDIVGVAVTGTAHWSRLLTRGLSDVVSSLQLPAASLSLSLSVEEK